MEKTKVLFVSQNITPYLAESHIGKISRHLPQGIQERGKEIRTFMPRFGNINERRNQLHEVIRLSGMNLIIDDSDHPLIIKVASIQQARMQVYFIDNEDYFQRKAIFRDKKGDFFEDNDERAIFFARGVLETVKKLGWSPDIIHCHGWMTSLVPLYAKTTFKDNPLFMDTKIVYSAYDDGFTEEFSDDFASKILFDEVELKHLKSLSQNNYHGLCKLGIDFSDAVIQGSEEMDKEIKNYIDNTKKPFLEFKDEEEYIDAYSDFYDKVLVEEDVIS
jgi:starch synthase